MVSAPCYRQFRAEILELFEALRVLEFEWAFVWVLEPFPPYPRDLLLFIFRHKAGLAQNGLCLTLKFFHFFHLN